MLHHWNYLMYLYKFSELSSESTLCLTLPFSHRMSSAGSFHHHCESGGPCTKAPLLSFRIVGMRVCPSLTFLCVQCLHLIQWKVHALKHVLWFLNMWCVLLKSPGGCKSTDLLRYQRMDFSNSVIARFLILCCSWHRHPIMFLPDHSPFLIYSSFSH